MHKGNYKRIIDQVYKVCCKLLEMENGLLKEKHAIGLLPLQIACVAGAFCCVFSFMVHKVRDTFAWKLN